MRLGIELIIIDNTSTKKMGICFIAQIFGYEVEIRMVGNLDEDNLKVYANRNKHGVSLDIIQKQAKRFEQ